MTEIPNSGQILRGTDIFKDLPDSLLTQIAAETSRVHHDQLYEKSSLAVEK